MGMSTNIVAFIPDTDETYQKHKKVLLACLEADVELPKTTAEYFNYSYPQECALEEKLTFDLKEGEHYQIFKNDWSRGFEIDLNKIPKEVKTIRFYNSF